MTTQAQGRGKKKSKEAMNVSLDEFNQIDSHRYSHVSLKMSGLDLAETRAKYDQKATEKQKTNAPSTPRAQRGPALDFNSLPNEPPFRVSLYNVPMSVDEKELADRFFQGLAIVKIETSKASTTVELESKQDLYEALCKDGGSIKGRTISVCMWGQVPPNQYGSDRFGGRGGNSSYGDRHGDRGGFNGPRSGDKYGDRDRSGGFGRDRDSYTGFSRGGSNQRGGYGDRHNDNRNNIRENNRNQHALAGGEPESEETADRRSRPTPLKPQTPSSYYAGAKFQTPPIPSLLPMPPSSWLLAGKK